MKSKMINNARLTKMTERNKCIMEVKQTMMDNLIQERLNNRERYLTTVKNCILQSMIKLLEPSLKVLCRDEDKSDIEGLIGDLENEFKEFMTEKTGRDEYECSLTVISAASLQDA